MIVILALSIASADIQCKLVVVDVENVMELGLYNLKLGSGAGTRRGGAVTQDFASGIFTQYLMRKAISLVSSFATRLSVKFSVENIPIRS
jgi:hypothetical protein